MTDSVRIGLKECVTPMLSVPVKWKQGLSGFGQTDSVAVTDEKHCPEFILQLLYLLRERALRYAQESCGIREIQGFSCFCEIS